MKVGVLCGVGVARTHVLVVPSHLLFEERGHGNPELIIKIWNVIDEIKR